MSYDETRGYLDPRDREYAATLDVNEREIVVSTVSRYRREDRLRVGDPLPTGELLRLESGLPLSLESLVTGRPLALVFGSFT